MSSEQVTAKISQATFGTREVKLKVSGYDAETEYATVEAEITLRDAAALRDELTEILEREGYR